MHNYHLIPAFQLFNCAASKASILFLFLQKFFTRYLFLFDILYFDNFQMHFHTFSTPTKGKKFISKGLGKKLADATLTLLSDDADAVSSACLLWVYVGDIL